MFSFVSFDFWLFFVYFFIAVFFAFFIPGDLLLSRLRFTYLQRLVLGSILGMVLWAWQGVIFEYFGVRWLSYLYLAAMLILWLKLNIEKKKLNILKMRPAGKIDPVIVMLVFFGVFTQLLTVWFTGVLFSDGFYFCCGNISDSLWYIALTNQLIKQIPPVEPGMAGALVYNYHYWANIILADLIRVFNLPLIPTASQYSAFFISLLLGLSAIVFSQIINIGKAFTRWFLFFLYFGGDSIYLLFLFLGKGFNFSMSSLEDGSKFLANPPRAFTIVCFFAGMSLLSLWLKKKDLYSGLLAALVLGTLIGLKVYVGIFALSGLGIITVYFLIKKNLRMIIPPIAAAIISLIVYVPSNISSGGLYYSGLWLFENFITQEKLGLSNLILAQRIFYEHHNWPRIIEYEIIFILIYIFSIFGTKIFGIFQTKRSLSLLPKELNIFLISGIIISAITGFLFQQQTGGSNTFNFLVSVFIIGSIYTALTCFYWTEKFKNKLKFLAILAVLLLTIPRVGYEVFSNIQLLRGRHGFFIDNNELDGLKYLKEKTDRLSLVLVQSGEFGLDVTTPYISFMADRPLYISGMGILQSHKVDVSERWETERQIFNEPDIDLVANLLFDSKIDYILMPSSKNFESTQVADFMENVYQNPKVKILKVSQNVMKEYLTK